MKRLTLKLKAFYLNARIKTKLFLLITMVMLTVSVVSLTVQQIAFDVYDNELYRQSANSLNLSSSSIENELKKMEQLSFRVATDPEIQNYLAIINGRESDYNQFLAVNAMRDRLLELGSLDKYVLSVQVYDSNGVEYAVGAKMLRSTEARIHKIVNEANEEDGGIRWIFPDESDNALVVSREIRYIPNLELQSIGTIAIRVDVERLFADFARGLNSEEAQFLIMDHDRLVYPRELPFSIAGISDQVGGSSGYRTVEIDGGRVFVTFVPSHYTDWVYLIVIPYNAIFQAVTAVKHTVLIAFALLFCIAIILAVRFARGITNPIESLNAKMKKVQLGNFELDRDLAALSFPMDETGQLHRNFRIMIQRINELITENYKKQIAIKESEFKALQAQINPHFLYNTLESINWSAKLHGHQQISRMVEALGYLLRSSISSKEPLIPLQHELEIIRNYITIQNIRFEERLDFTMDVPLALTQALVPKFSLQPLVENSIIYGLEEVLGTCRVRITAAIDNDVLRITVEDNGPGMDAARIRQFRAGTLSARGSGIGLRNIDDRIKLLFGESYGIAIASNSGVGTAVTVSLPVRMGGNHVQSIGSG